MSRILPTMWPLCQKKQLLPQCQISHKQWPKAMIWGMFSQLCYSKEDIFFFSPDGHHCLTRLTLRYLYTAITLFLVNPLSYFELWTWREKEKTILLFLSLIYWKLISASGTIPLPHIIGQMWRELIFVTEVWNFSPTTFLSHRSRRYIVCCREPPSDVSLMTHRLRYVETVWTLPYGFVDKY
jgi:hypothetical protein